MTPRRTRAAGLGHLRATTRRKRVGVDRSSMVVKQTIASYATRGIFRAYGDQPGERGQSRFSFRWHSDAAFHVVFDSSRRELMFRDLLPAVTSRSPMYRELKAFVEARTSPTLPEHRRIDPRKVRVAVKNRHQKVSLAVSLKDSHLEYGVRKAVNLIHEVFVEFLRNPLYFAYMVEHFQVDPDA